MTSTLRMLVTLCAAALFFTALGACGGDRGDDDDDGSSCAGAGRAICQAACDCREGDGCGITDAAGGATLGFDTPSDCEGLYVTLGCSGGGDGSIDFAACSADVEVAECQGTGTDAAVVLPASCDSN